MSIIYKILFEINILHEYYLTRSDGRNIFDLITQAEKQTFLIEEFESERDNIKSILNFEISRSDQEVFSQYKLKLLPTFSGFKIAMAVNQKVDEGGFISYIPQNAIPENLSINIRLINKDAQIEQITNSRIARNFTSSWFFTNQNINGFKSLPFLTQPVSSFDPVIIYEQGELAKFDSGEIKGFYMDAEGNERWDNNIGLSGFANENDRMIVPYGFYYSFNMADEISTASFKLFDSDNVLVESVQFSGADIFKKLYLQFTEAKLASVEEGVFYKLIVEGNNAYKREHNIAFHNDAVRFWGIICIKPKVAKAEFNLLNEDGSLKTIKTPDGFFDPPPPLFEIPFRSRRTFWRYVNDRRKYLRKDLFLDFLNPVSGKLITKTPRPLTLVSTLFKNQNGETYLPNPRPGDVFRIEANKIYSDILVPESKDLFPIQA